MKTIFTAVILMAATGLSRADLLEQFGLGKKSTNQTSGLSSGLTGLSQDQMIAGLKEALSKGVQSAIGNLGQQSRCTAQRMLPHRAIGRFG